MDERAGTGEVVTSRSQARARATGSHARDSRAHEARAGDTDPDTDTRTDTGTDVRDGGLEQDAAARPSIGPDWAWRRRLRERRATYQAYRMGVATLGVTVVIVGLILVPLPGPGWLIVFFGLAILASEFQWAKRLHQRAAHHLRNWNDWVMARPLGVRFALAIATFVLVVAFFWVVLKLAGIPDIVPEWITQYLRAYVAL